MAHVSGPTSGLPGQVTTPPSGTLCDEHPGRLAVARVQGETDSFGAEYADMCEDCLKAFREAPTELAEGTCDWCKASAVDRLPTRDYEEGTRGPVYYVCGACRIRQVQRGLEDYSSY